MNQETQKMVPEVLKNGEEICRIRDKKPAHEVVVEMIRETMESLNDPHARKDDVESVPILLKIGILSALLEVLKRMVIPEKHFHKVLDALWEIKNNCPVEYAEKLISERFFPILSMSQPSWGKNKTEEEKLIGMEKEIGHRIPYDCIKEEEVKEARMFSESDASQEEKTARINSLMNRAGSCPLCRRAILKVFGT